MKDAGRVKLLFGPYKPPRQRKGNRATCLFRDRDVVVTGWTDARVPWPVAVPAGPGRVGRSSLLVDDELARAIRHESAAALRHWWGVSSQLVWKWRMALGVTRTNNPGSGRLIRAAAESGAAKLRGVSLPPDQVERRRHTAVEKGLGRNLRLGYHGDCWSPGELALLGTAPDTEVARRVGRTPNAVRVKRERLGIPNPALRLRPWSPEEDEAVRSLRPAEAAEATGRTLSAVSCRQSELGLRNGRDSP